jgi:metal-dependent amidase/aminoacylase/carboxypeptidase family protein
MMLTHADLVELTAFRPDLHRHPAVSGQEERTAGAIAAEYIPLIRGDTPLRAPEDFGRFGTTACAAMFDIGAGETHAALHHPDCDFADDLIPLGMRTFHRVIRNPLG